MSEKKLWVVRVLREAYVLAETEEQAEDLVLEIERVEKPAVEVSSGSVNLGWAENCLVYHTGNGDITLAQARRNFAPAELEGGR